MSDKSTVEWVYFYIRDNITCRLKNVLKQGVTHCLVERGSQYVTYEPELGEFVLVIKIYGNKIFVDDHFKRTFINMNIRETGGGTEYYMRSLISHIEPWLKTTGLQYNILTTNDIGSIPRMKRQRREANNTLGISPLPEPIPIELSAPSQPKSVFVKRITKKQTDIETCEPAPIERVIYMNKVLEFYDWNPKSHKYMAPKVNDKGGKSIVLISEQIRHPLLLDVPPLVMTWKIANFCDEQGNSDGKYRMSLNFPNPKYKSNATDEFLKKMIEFQEKILDDAVNNSELWWGEKMSKELVKHTFFPLLKYPKDKTTKKVDLSRPPSMSVKVPFSGNKWDIKLFDTKCNQIFPCEDPSLTPVDFVPKLSKVGSTIKCTGIWIGGKGWGLTWKLIHAFVQPKESQDIRRICHMKLSEDDKKIIESQEADFEDPDNYDILAASSL
jgi:hypothetical protein